MHMYKNKEWDKKHQDKRQQRTGPKWAQADRPRPAGLAHSRDCFATASG
jgi:hypothetical protein